MAGDIEIVRADDARAAELTAAGYVVVGESWGARLRLGEPPELSHARAAVSTSTVSGYVIRELDASWAAEVTRLEAANHTDYPITPATTQPQWSERDVLALWSTGCRAFGALAGDRLVAVSVIRRGDDRHGETEFTSVDAAHRRRGLAVAVKAASILALSDDGVRVFGTGGAALNAGSIRMNESLGYVVEERWLSLAPPTADR